jgi:hypothetical protein
MSKSAKKQPTASAPATVPTTKSSRHSAGEVSSNTGSIDAHVEWEATPVAVLQTCDSLRDALKQAMRRLASSVTIISANEDGAVYGLAATAVTSLALDPHP